MVTHPGTNRAQCIVTTLIETNALLLNQIANHVCLVGLEITTNSEIKICNMP